MDYLNGKQGEEKRTVDIQCADASAVTLPAASLDAVLTDPPYFGNVQYAELMDFCYVWLRRLLGRETGAFEMETTRNPQELTGNVDMGRGLAHFTEGLSSTFGRIAIALKPGAPLAFTYHHNDLKAYYPIVVAILDAGLTCSASLPCPAEMGASIHISGTGSSIIDTIFVCRSTGAVPRRWVVDSIRGVADLVNEDLAKLRSGNVEPTSGDTRCIAYGHLARLAVWSLRKTWNKASNTSSRISAVAAWFHGFGGWNEVERYLKDSAVPWQDAPLFAVREKAKRYRGKYAEISF